jgi:hypothetical protein
MGEPDGSRHWSVTDAIAFVDRSIAEAEAAFRESSETARAILAERATELTTVMTASAEGTARFM